MMSEYGTAIVIGPDGFIGQNFMNRMAERGLTRIPLRRETELSELPEDPVDYVFFCAGNSAAFRTREDPEYCLNRNVVDLHRYLIKLNYDKFVHISSTAVYPQEFKKKSEDARLDPRELSLYGSHKLLSERYVQEYAPEWLILRPAYLYGPGLWKNIFYDLRTGQGNIYLTKDSQIAALNVSHLADAALSLARDVSGEVFNVGSEHVVSVRKLLEMVDEEPMCHGERHLDQRGIDLRRLEEYWEHPLSKEEYLEALREFIESGDVDAEKGL